MLKAKSKRPARPRLERACPEAVITECLSAGYALWWTLLLLLPVHLFATNPAFTALARVAPEWRWGLVMLGVGLWNAVACGWLRPVWRWLGLAAANAAWAFLAACLRAPAPAWHGLPVAIGFGGYSLLAFANFCGMVALFPYVWADMAAVWLRSGWARRQGG